MAKAVFPVAQADQALFGQLGQQLLAKGAVQHGVGFLFVVEGQGQVQHAKGFDQRHQRGGVRHRHLQRAAAQGRCHAHVVAQRAAGKQLGVHLAAALGGQFFGKVLDGQCLGVVFAQADAYLEHMLFDLRGHRGGQSGQHGGGQGEGFELHVCLRWYGCVAAGVPPTPCGSFVGPSVTQAEG